MRKGIATPETRNNPKLTIVVKTRTPLEAFQMLRMGQPVDQQLGYYLEEYEGKDLHLMDNIEKLHLLAHFKQLKATHQSDYNYLLTQIQANEKKGSEPSGSETSGGGVPN